MNIVDILKSHESKVLEFKENIQSKDKLLATIIAFANTAGGKLIIGIEDKTKYVVGIEDPYAIEERLSAVISDTISPRLDTVS